MYIKRYQADSHIFNKGRQGGSCLGSRSWEFDEVAVAVNADKLRSNRLYLLQYVCGGTHDWALLLLVGPLIPLEGHGHNKCKSKKCSESLVESSRLAGNIGSTTPSFPSPNYPNPNNPICLPAQLQANCQILWNSPICGLDMKQAQQCSECCA